MTGLVRKIYGAYTRMTLEHRPDRAPSNSRGIKLLPLTSRNEHLPPATGRLNKANDRKSGSEANRPREGQGMTETGEAFAFL